jgi:hypothetical protein
LDRAQPYPPELRHPDAFREDMVYSTVRVELNGNCTMVLAIASANAGGVPTPAEPLI